MNNTNQLGRLLDFSEVIKFADMRDFLRQEPAMKNQNVDDDTKKKEELVYYKDINEYICQNTECVFLERKEELDSLHIFEIDGNTMITICNHCYDQGYRFCIFTHEVSHIKYLDPVLQEMYAKPEYHRGQLNPKVLDMVADIDQYFRTIGIDNPNPTHTVIDLLEDAD